ncbi:PilZ domain-containing protein [Clostridium malenominatum]|uniref:PilZ domain-containing protein n=1 Tax=Clostridium malenominatum TaxID=1539 RepID=A0ABN1IUX0_9CLOT
MDSKIYRNGEYVYINSSEKNEKRDVELDIYYPRVNNKSIYENYKSSEPVMKGIKIDSEGITLISKTPLIVGDFVNFSIALGEYPSFWCLCEVKYVQYEDTNCKAQCEFYSLTMEQINMIKEYMNGI